MWDDDLYKRQPHDKSWLQSKSSHQALAGDSSVAKRLCLLSLPESAYKLQILALLYHIPTSKQYQYGSVSSAGCRSVRGDAQV